MELINLINDCDKLGLEFGKSLIGTLDVQIAILDCLLIDCGCDAFIPQGPPRGSSFIF